MFAASTASAFQCPGKTTFETAYSSSPIIVLAEVLAIENKPGHWGDTQIVDVDVRASWKGPLKGKQRIQAGGMRGPWLKLGEQYLIFASEWQGAVQVSLCMRTQEYSRATVDLLRLGVPAWTSIKPFQATPEESSGLSVSVSPVKPVFDDVFDDIGFKITFHNKSRSPLRLPGRIEAPGSLIDIVVRRKGEWWTTLTREKLEEQKIDWSALKPGESRSLIVSQSGRHISDRGEHEIQAVIHYSTTTAGFWTGYVFSKPSKLTVIEFKEPE